MDKELKSIIAAEQTTRTKLDGFIIEKGQGVIFFLDENELYDGNTYLDITEEGELVAPNSYPGELKTMEDLTAYWKARRGLE